MRIFLVRHGMSQSNEDWSVNQRVADHAIALSEEGKRQAREAGAFLARYFAENLVLHQAGSLGDKATALLPKIRIWNSPYLRTRQTRDEIVRMCLLPELPETHDGRLWRRAGDLFAHCRAPGDLERLRHPEPGTSWFLDQKEHFLLHEQQFGIFDGLDDNERETKYPAETAYYEKCKAFEGKVWAKLPMGESRMDVARRMHQASGTFKRDEEKHGIKDIVVVGHGTTNRCFTMSWLHLPFEWLEKEPNPKNCSVRLLEDGEDKGYIFEGFDNPPGYKHKTNRETEE